MIATTIKLSPNTKHELDLFREYKSESYDEVINKLVYIARNVKNMPQLSEETIEQIEKARERVKKGFFINEKEAMKRLGL